MASSQRSTNTYRAAEITAPGRVDLKALPRPSLGADEVLIEVKASAICGSDLHLYRGKHPDAKLPSAVGHELAGDVVERGSAVTRFKLGDRVLVEPIIPCGTCHYCRLGEYNRCQNIKYGYRMGRSGLAEYYVAAEQWVHHLPTELSYAEGALVEPLAVATHATRRAGVGLGDSVAIFGAGPIGLLTLAVCKAAGAERIFMVDIRQDRLAMAASLEATEVIDARLEEPVEYIRQATGGLGVSRTFEAVGAQGTLVSSLMALRKGGIATLIGIFENPQVTLEAPIFVSREIGLLGSTGYCWDFPTAIGLARKRTVDLARLITHRFPLSEIDRAFAAAVDRDLLAVKVIVEP
ncbi:MAG TPA: alcohol dehydrogenase catalytic domain-containing protein [Bacillota bacterium]|jgi:threonine dehydrogenase-like Zn-dependent dehydrogenase